MGRAVPALFRIASHSDHPARKSFTDLLILPDIAVYDKDAILWQKLCKPSEGVSDIIDILKEIQMVRLDVQNDLHGGKKGQEAVGIFTGLGHEHLRAAHTDIAADGVQHPPYGNGGVLPCLHQDLRQHGGGGGLSMGSRHGHRLVIISHDLAQKLRPGKDRDGPSRCGCIFRVVGMDCGRIDHHVGPFHNILRFLSVKELCSVGLQLLCELRLPGVGTGYGKSPFQQDLR